MAGKHIIYIGLLLIKCGFGGVPQSGNIYSKIMEFRKRVIVITIVLVSKKGGART